MIVLFRDLIINIKLDNFQKEEMSLQKYFIKLQMKMLHKMNLRRYRIDIKI